MNRTSCGMRRSCGPTSPLQVDALTKKLVRYEDELSAQALAVEGMADEREAARNAMQVGPPLHLPAACCLLRLASALNGKRGMQTRSAHIPCNLWV